ncbi:piggyBac transposable element-derived protein 4-like [Penaeus japonicus]|uniref:piggyBac transposable element-derived protein 4-like n=1 Tax=Penaeus japonicus TaxID=27405 RepID=UPI001C715A07|nr:piggyBac transposable element-derived protein 4-like [Penaeus japonicus]
MAGRQTTKRNRAVTEEEIDDILFADICTDLESEDSSNLSHSDSESDEEFLQRRVTKRRRQLEPEVIPESNAVSEAQNVENGPQRLEGNNTSWEWRSTPFIPYRHDFDEATSGLNPNLGLSAASQEIDLFCHFFDEPLISYICDETNRFHEQTKENVTLTPSSRLRQWTPVGFREFYLFLALMLLTPHVKKNELPLYWSKDPLIHTTTFGHIMSYRRFVLLLHNLHFVNNNNAEREPDRLKKIRPVLSMIADISKCSDR